MSKQGLISGADIKLLRTLERYLRLELTEKMTVCVSFVIISLVIFALGSSAVFFLCSGLVISLSDVLGSVALANYVVGGGLVIIICCFYFFRVPLVENRVVEVLSSSILRSELLKGQEVADGEGADDAEEKGGAE